MFVYSYCYVCFVLCILFLCIVICIFCVSMCTVLLPPGVNPVAVNKYITINQSSKMDWAENFMYRKINIGKLF